MARIRTIKPEITMDEELAELGFAARWFFINLWCHCDREGRCEDRPKMLQAKILPWDLKVDADTLLKELDPKFVIRYEVEGKKYLQVRTFVKHQRPKPEEQPSVIPPVPNGIPKGIPKDTKESPKGNHKVSQERIGDREVRIGKGERNGVTNATRASFTTPNVDEVRAYCSERHNNIDPQHFCDFYQARGWMIGKNKMKDWKAAVRTWEKNDYPVSSQKIQSTYNLDPEKCWSCGKPTPDDISLCPSCRWCISCEKEFPAGELARNREGRPICPNCLKK